MGSDSHLQVVDAQESPNHPCTRGIACSAVRAAQLWVLADEQCLGPGRYGGISQLQELAPDGPARRLRAGPVHKPSRRFSTVLII